MATFNGLGNNFSGFISVHLCLEVSGVQLAGETNVKLALSQVRRIASKPEVENVNVLTMLAASAANRRSVP